MADPIGGSAAAVQNLGETLGRALKDGVQPFAATLDKLGQALKVTILPIVSKLTQSLTNAVAPAFKAVADAVGSALTPALEKIGKIAAPIAAGLGTVAASLGGIVKAGTVATAGLVGFGEAIGGMVAKANPGVFARFQYAVADLMATIGEGLAPVLEVVTRLVRMAGDTLATFATTLGGGLAVILDSLTPVLEVIFDLFGRIGQAVGKVVEALAPAFTTLGQVFGEILEALQPVINLFIDIISGVLVDAFRLLAEYMKAVAPYVIAFYQVIGELVSGFLRWIKEALAFIGVEFAEGGPGTVKGAGFGKATRQAEIGSIESVIQKAQISAYTFGSGGAEDPAKKTASAVESLKAEAARIRGEMNKIGERVGDVADYILDLPGKIASALRTGAEAVADTAVDTFDRVAEAVEDFGLDVGSFLARAVGLGDELKPRGGTPPAAAVERAERTWERWSPGAGGAVDGDF